MNSTEPKLIAGAFAWAATALATLSPAPFGITVAPFFIFRSALPVNLIDGRDLNLDGETNDIPAIAYRMTGYDADTGSATFGVLKASYRHTVFVFYD